MPVTTGLANAIVTGIITGSIVALGAIGLALVYSIAEVPNFAHGDLLMVGAFLALFVNKPGTVPVLELLATGPRGLAVAGFVVLFLLAAGSTLSMIYLLGGRSALEGGWWPRKPSPAVGLAVHLLGAVVIGAVVVAGVPSLWAGVILAAVVMGNLAPLTEKLVFGKFRAKEATLATMLIVSLGVSFILRFGTQAIFGGGFRSYSIPDSLPVGGDQVFVSAAKFYDFYQTGAGITLQVIDTGPEGNEVVSTALYSWPVIVGIVVLTVGAAYGASRWRRSVAGGRNEVQTLGPRLAALIAGVGVFAVLGLLLGSPSSVPGSYGAGTRIRLFPVKVLILVVSVLMMAILHVLLQESKLGTAMRASADNLDLAKVTGINTDRVMMATWILAGLFAGIAGVLLGLTVRVQVNVGFFLLLPMFAAAILGGIRSIYGVILGSFVVGLSMDVGFYLLGGVISGNQYRPAIAFIVLFVVLLVKPEGIAGGSS